jgi:ABC-type Fe3+ transport system permease subunit
MIIRNASGASLLTGQNAAGQRPAIAHDRSDPTAVLVFSSVIDDVVIVDLLSNSAVSTPMSVYIYSQQHGGNGGPALNALGTIMLVMSFIIAILGYFGYRVMTRGERGSTTAALTTIAGG